MKKPTWLDRFAAKLGYVRRERSPVEFQKAGYADTTAFVPTPGAFGLAEDVTFIVSRRCLTTGRLVVSDNRASFHDVIGFMDACGLKPGVDRTILDGVFAGAAFEIDGAEMTFRIST
jgi:hypothetical protein